MLEIISGRAGSGKTAYCLEQIKNKLLAQPVAIRRRVLREAYFSLAGAELDQERTLALEQLVVNGTGGKLVQLPGGVTARYINKQLFLEKQ